MRPRHSSKLSHILIVRRGPKDSEATRCFLLKGLTLSLLLALGSTSVSALPVGGVVTSGSASINTTPRSTTITQTTQNAAIGWQSFNIGAKESVFFSQPNSRSVTVNQVLGTEPSGIFGRMSANGRVFLINPNGIVFGQGASVNVGGLVASTLKLSQSDFTAGTYKLDGNGKATVINEGNLLAAKGGFIALIAAEVSNRGHISAPLGNVTLAGGARLISVWRATAL